MLHSVSIILALLILLSYSFDLSSRRTRIPTVMLLLLLGWGVHQIVMLAGIQLPNLKTLLPLLGETGLLLIVLEGALELDFNKEKKTVLRQSSLSALIPIILLGFVIGFGLHWYTGRPIVTCLVNALPFSVISSAIAIPSAAHLSPRLREFIIYESSLSDIFGVILFNFFTAGEVINGMSAVHFIGQLVIMLIISFAASVALAYFIRKVEHRVKFIPIILIVFIIYSISKIYNLPSLIFILIFGILLNNLEELKRFKFIQKLEPAKFETEVHRFREIVMELSFLVRSVFFLLFGYLIDVHGFLSVVTFAIAGGVVALVLIIRYAQLRIAKLSRRPLLYLAPRGLVSVLLFLSIPKTMQLPVISEQLMILVIILSALTMMFGLMFGNEVSVPEEVPVLS